MACSVALLKTHQAVHSTGMTQRASNAFVASSAMSGSLQLDSAVTRLPQKLEVALAFDCCRWKASHACLHATCAAYCSLLQLARE